MAKIPPAVEVRNISLERKVNSVKGWSEWSVGEIFFPDVEDAVLFYYSAAADYSGIRTPYRLWKEAFRRIGSLRSASSNKLVSALQSLESGASDSLKKLIKSTERKGAPDLLLEREGELYFVEVKVSDSLSKQQSAWLKGMIDAGLNVFVVRVKPVYIGAQVTEDEYLIREFEKQMTGYISDADNPEIHKAFAHAKRSLTNFNGYSLISSLEFESRIHKLYTAERLEETFKRLAREKKRG